MAGEVLDQMASGFAPIASGWQPQYRTGFEGVPVASSHPVLSMLAQPYLASMMGGSGLVPMGAGHDQNAYDTIRHRAFNAQQRQAMANMAWLERENVMRTARGVSAIAGQPFGADQRRAAGYIADSVAYAAPIAAMVAPEMLDQMSGLRGSPTVLANRMMMGGRYQYDPATGRMGIGADSMGTMAGRMYQDLYGSRDSLMSMHGLSAGQAGGLYQGLVSRGMVGMEPGSLQARARAAIGGLGADDFNRAAMSQGVSNPAGRLTASDIDKLTLDPGVADRIRNFDASRITQAIKSYSGAVAAVKDIFGDLGQPNAPMSQLIQRLEGLTAGGLAQMDPERAGRIVRQTYNLARSTGVDFNSAMVMQQHAAGRAAQMGLEPIFAVSALQGGMAFGGAYRGMGLASHTAWGAMNADQLQQLDMNLRLGASSSNAANRLAVVSRLADAHGGFQAGSAADSLTRAIDGGLPSFRGADGTMQSIGGLTQRDFYSILSGSKGQSGQNLGITENTIREMLGQRFDNREAIDRKNIGNTLRNQQGAHEVIPFLANRLRETMASRLTEIGVDKNIAKDSLAQVGRAAMDRIMGMSTADFSSPGERTGRMAEILGEELSGTEAGATLAAMKPAERNAFLRSSAVQFYGRANTAIASSGFKGIENMQVAHRAFDPRVLAKADLQQQSAAFESRMQEALSPLGKGTMLSRAFEAVGGARPGDDLREVIGSALGGVRAADISTRVSSPLASLNTKMEAIKGLQAEITRTKPGPARDEMEKRLDGMLREAKAESAGVLKTAQDFGLFGSGLTARDTRYSIDISRAVASQVVDASSMRGGFGLEVDARAAAMARLDYNSRPKADWEAANVLMARNRANAGNISPERLHAVTQQIMTDMPQIGLTEAASMAKKRIYDQNMANATLLDDKDVAKEMLQGKLGEHEHAATAALVLKQRQMTGLTPTDGMVATTLAEMRRTHPQATEDDARNLARSRLRARRWGIAGSEISDIQDQARAKGRGISEQEALGIAVDARERSQFEGTPKQLEERAKLRAERFASFWGNEDGKLFRDNVKIQAEQAEATAAKLLDPDVARRFGTQATDMSNSLREIQQRRRVLAFRYAGGSIERLLAGDTKGIGNMDEYVKLRDELAALQGGERGIYDKLHATHGKGERQFRLGDEAKARLNLPTTANAAQIKAERERVGNIEEAANLMGMKPEDARNLLSTADSVLSPEMLSQKKSLSRRVLDVSIARRVTVDDETRLRAFGDRDQTLELLAARHGTTTKALLEAARGGPADIKLTELSDAERERRDAALKDYEASRRASTEAGGDIRAAERSLAHLSQKLGQSGLSDGERANLEKRHASERARLSELKLAKDGADKRMVASATAVGPDAKRRGVTGDQYLQGQGFVTTAERNRILAEEAKMGKSFEEIKKIADRLGVRPDDMSSVVKNVIEPQMRLADEARRREEAGGMGAVQDIAKEFGVSFDAGDRRTQELANKFSGTEGKDWAKYIAWTQKQIADNSKGKMAGGELASRWMSAMAKTSPEDREKALKQLQVDAGIDTSNTSGKARWDRLTDSLDFQKRAGLLDGRDGRMTVDRISKAFDAIRSAGDLKKPGAGGPGGSQELRLHGRVDVNLTGRYIDFNGRTGGVLGNTATP